MLKSMDDQLLHEKMINELSKIMYRQRKWDLRFLEMAKLVSSWSKDPSTQAGAVVTKDNQIISVGYNGLPKGIADDNRLDNRELKYKMIIHCEVNAYHKAHKDDLKGATLYTWPFMSCSVCCSQGIQVGIKRMVAPVNNNPRWVESFKLTRDMCNEAGIELVEIDWENLDFKS
jgi:dCMP deaminase